MADVSRCVLEWNHLGDGCSSCVQMLKPLAIFEISNSSGMAGLDITVHGPVFEPEAVIQAFESRCAEILVGAFHRVRKVVARGF